MTTLSLEIDRPFAAVFIPLSPARDSRFPDCPLAWLELKDLQSRALEKDLEAGLVRDAYSLRAPDRGSDRA